MSRSSKFLVLFLPLFAGITFFLTSPRAQEKRERIKGEELGTYIVRIIEHGGLYPKEAKVKPGTTVIWVNTTTGFAEIYFTGKQVEIACKAPVHFVAHPTEGGYYSDRIPPGAVASLCFIERGTFEYKLAPAAIIHPSAAPVGKEIKGAIIVE